MTPNLLTDLAAVAVAVSAIVGAVGLLWRFGPLRWLGRRLITQPASELLDAHLAPVRSQVEQLRVDLTSHMAEEERKLAADLRDRQHRQEILDARLEGFDAKLDAIGADIARNSAEVHKLHRRVDSILLRDR